MWNNLFRSVDLIQQGLSASWTRNAVIRHNIANIETPGFQASDVEFESLLREALEDGGEVTGFQRARTHEGHINGGFQGAATHTGHIPIGGRVVREVDPMSVEAQIIRRQGTSMRMDGNNVDIESENVKLAQNSLQYNTLLAKMNSELNRLRMAITEGR